MKKFQIKKDNNIFSRFEFKYILKKKISESIKSEVKQFMQQDNFTKYRDYYLVRSLYFDNYFFSHFHDKIDGVKNRHKFRIRTYAENEKKNVPIFLEMKGRNNLRTFKNRTSVNIDDLLLFYKKENIFNLKKRYSNNDLIHNFIFDIYKKNITPKVLIDYKRLPLVSKNGLYFRLTFDSELQACVSNNIFGNDYNWKSCIPGYDILEVKFDFTIPPWFHRIIQNYQLKRLSVSKFVLGLEATNLAYDYEGR
jgi:hypothetical protein